MPAAQLAPLLSTVVAAQDAVLYGSQGAWQMSNSRVEDSAIAVVALSLVAASILGVVWMRHRTRLQEKRLDLLRELAAKGQITPAMIEDHLRPGGRIKSIIMVVAWFMLLGGGTMLGVAFAKGWPYRHSEIGEPGIVILVIAIATLSTPLMLREMRRQNAL